MENKQSYILIKSTEQVQQQVIVNGVPQGGQKVKAYHVECNACGKVLAQFNPGDPYRGVLDTVQNRMSNDIIYCPKCGSKLIYNCEVIDALVTENTSE